MLKYPNGEINMRELTVTAAMLDEHGAVILDWLSGKDLQVKLPNLAGSYLDVQDPKFVEGFIYRVKPAYHTVNWILINKEIKYMAVDLDGKAFFYKQKPEIDNDTEGYWYAPWHTSFDYSALKDFFEQPPLVYELNPNVGWANSLTKRPE